MEYKRGRTPIIALDYKDKHKAVEKEIMIDYSTGNIYVVSAEDRSIIFDVTSKILKQIDSVKGENVEVIIEGVGTIKLTEYLSKINQKLNSQIKVNYLSDEVSYFSKSNVYDNRSIHVVNNDVTLHGFREAESGTVPVKDRNGKLKWVHPMGGAIGGTGDGSNSTNGNNGLLTIGREMQDHGSIIAPSNPDNGQILKAVDNAPYNGKIYLRASRRQVTKEPTTDLKVVLPSDIIDQYSEIQWMLLTSADFAPKLEFIGDGAIFWDNKMDTQPKADSHNLYTFKTWTGGAKWIATSSSFNNSSFTNITSDYLDVYYYSKSEIDSGFYNKEYINEHYYDKPGTDARISEYAETDDMWDEEL